MSGDPYAMFRFQGAVIEMSEYQFKQALADSRLCHCGDCLCCRVAEYRRDAEQNKSHSRH